MGAVENTPALGWLQATANWVRGGLAERSRAPRIGLALGGGFARGIAHIGVLRALEKNNIPIHAIAGVSSGAMVAAAFAGGSKRQRNPADCVIDEVSRRRALDAESSGIGR